MMSREAWMQPAPDPASPKGAWWRVLLTGFLLYAVSVALLVLTRNPNLFPTVIILGNFLVPVTFVTFLYQRQHLSHLTLPSLGLSFFYGGVLGVLAASLLEPLVVPHGRTPFLAPLAVRVIEECAKISSVVVLAPPVCHDSED